VLLPALVFYFVATQAPDKLSEAYHFIQPGC
jgi:hypothetical protein